MSISNIFMNIRYQYQVYGEEEASAAEQAADKAKEKKKKLLLRPRKRLRKRKQRGQRHRRKQQRRQRKRRGRRKRKMPNKMGSKGEEEEKERCRTRWAKLGPPRPAISRCPGEHKKKSACVASIFLRLSSMTKRECYRFCRVTEITLDTSLLELKTQNKTTVN